MDSDWILNDKLRKLYSLNMAMEPPEVLVGLSDYLAKFLVPVFQLYCDEEFHIAIGYYASDVKADIGYLNSYSSRNTLFFNLYLTEYVADFLIYLKYRDQHAFRFFFAKQMRNAELIRGNREASALYNRLYLKYKDSLEDGILKHLLEAMIASLFVAFHELAHQDTESISKVSSDFCKLCEQVDLPDYTSEEIVEISCDFIALMISDIHKIDESNSFSKGEFIGLAGSIMLLVDLYRCFNEFAIDAVNKGNQNLDRSLKNLTTTLHKRSTGLMALIASYYKQGNVFQNLDFEDARRVFVVVGELLDRIKQFYDEDFENEIEEYTSLSSEEKEKYNLHKTKDAWFYYV